MEKSESIKEISKALSLLQKNVGAVSKDGTNPFFKSKYATFENIVAHIKEPMRGFGLSYTQFPDGDGLYTLIMHESGEWIGAHANLELKGHTPQDQGSAITYMRRYALSAALGLATEEDDDGNAASKTVTHGVPIIYNKTPKPIPPAKVANTRDALKARIKELVDATVLVPLTRGEEYKGWVSMNTGYELVPENFEAIIDVLEAKKQN